MQVWEGRGVGPYGGWASEHRRVMEHILGRLLLPGETPHHRNGQKADNRPGNLELWVTKQPKGQRAEDLVEFAREILGRYGSPAERRRYPSV